MARTSRATRPAFGVQQFSSSGTTCRLLLGVRCRRCLRADAPTTQPHAGRGQPSSQTDAAPGAAENPPLRELTRRRGAISSTSRSRLLSIISDIEFPRGGARGRPDAGLELARHVRQRRPDITGDAPIEPGPKTGRWLARSARRFSVEGSPTLLAAAPGSFVVGRLGFGDFVFRLPDGREVGRARDLRELEEQLATVPPESLRVSRRAQSLLELVQGAHGVRPRRGACARARSRTSRRSRICGASWMRAIQRIPSERGPTASSSTSTG